LIKNLKAIEAALNGGGSLGDVIKYLNTTISELQKVRTEAEKEPIRHSAWTFCCARF
jgi:hypothetical protein